VALEDVVDSVTAIASTVDAGNDASERVAETTRRLARIATEALR
jgi:vacuolar-type H+-ATPase catalytic subunit A/Vma1